MTFLINGINSIAGVWRPFRTY